MTAVGERFVVTGAKGVNVRGGPGTDYAVVDTLAANASVMAIGKVKASDWYLVGRGNVAIGYVAASLIQRAPDITPPTTPPRATAGCTADGGRDVDGVLHHDADGEARGRNIAKRDRDVLPYSKRMGSGLMRRNKTIRST